MEVSGCSHENRWEILDFPCTCQAPFAAVTDVSAKVKSSELKDWNIKYLHELRRYVVFCYRDVD